MIVILDITKKSRSGIYGWYHRPFVCIFFSDIFSPGEVDYPISLILPSDFL